MAGPGTIDSFNAAAIGATDGAWLHGTLTLTTHGTVYTATVSPSVYAKYLKVIVQASATDTTPVEAIVCVNADPSASTSSNIDGVGYPVEGAEVIPLDGTKVVTVRVMATNADAAYARIALSNEAVT